MVLSAVVLAGCSSGGGSDSPSANGPRQVTPGPYRMTMPKAILGGTFTESDHAEPDQNIASALSGQVENGVTAFATYQPANRKSDTEGTVVAVIGVYGTVLSPVTAREEFLKFAESRSVTGDVQTTVIIGPRTFTPGSSSEPVSCRIVRKTDSTGTSWQPGCSWADGSAVARVSESVDPRDSPADYDLEALAAKTATVRNEVRTPVTP